MNPYPTATKCILDILRSKNNSPIFYKMEMGVGKFYSLIECLKESDINHLIVDSRCFSIDDLHSIIIDSENQVIVFSDIHNMRKPLIDDIFLLKDLNKNIILTGDLDNSDLSRPQLNRLLIVE